MNLDQMFEWVGKQYNYPVEYVEKKASEELRRRNEDHEANGRDKEFMHLAHGEMLVKDRTEYKLKTWVVDLERGENNELLTAHHNKLQGKIIYASLVITANNQAFIREYFKKGEAVYNTM